MNIIVAALAMLLLTTVQVLPAGFAPVMVPDPNGPPLEAGIWYPSDAPASSHRRKAIGIFVVAAFAARTAGVVIAAITVTRRTNDIGRWEWRGAFNRDSNGCDIGNLSTRPATIKLGHAPQARMGEGT